MTSDVETQLRDTLARLNPSDSELPRLKHIAAIGAHDIDFSATAFHKDANTVYQSLIYAAQSGMAIDPDFEITPFALPERNFFRNEEHFDMACLLYLPGKRAGCEIYNGRGHDELDRTDPTWNYIVAPGHHPDNWQKALHEADVQFIAAFGGWYELTADMLCREGGRASAYTCLHANPPYACSGQADAAINLSAIYKKQVDVPSPWLGFCADQAYLQNIAPWLGHTTIAQAGLQVALPERHYDREPPMSHKAGL